MITLEGIVDQIKQVLNTIEQGQKGEYEGIQAKVNDEEFDWEADWGDEENMIGKKVKVHIADMDTRRWKEDLEADLSILNGLRGSIEDVKEKNDTKLQHLISLINEKINTPFNPGNRKIIVFTAFADTANYLYKNIEGYLKKEYGIHTALITGSKKKM